MKVPSVVRWALVRVGGCFASSLGAKDAVAATAPWHRSPQLMSRCLVSGPYLFLPGTVMSVCHARM